MDTLYYTSRVEEDGRGGGGRAFTHGQDQEGGHVEKMRKGRNGRKSRKGRKGRKEGQEGRKEGRKANGVTVVSWLLVGAKYVQ